MGGNTSVLQIVPDSLRNTYFNAVSTQNPYDLTLQDRLILKAPIEEVLANRLYLINLLLILPIARSKFSRTVKYASIGSILGGIFVINSNNGVNLYNCIAVSTRTHIENQTKMGKVFEKTMDDTVPSQKMHWDKFMKTPRDEVPFWGPTEKRLNQQKQTIMRSLKQREDLIEKNKKQSEDIRNSNIPQFVEGRVPSHTRDQEIRTEVPRGNTSYVDTNYDLNNNSSSYGDSAFSEQNEDESWFKSFEKQNNWNFSEQESNDQHSVNTETNNSYSQNSRQERIERARKRYQERTGNVAPSNNSAEQQGYDYVDEADKKWG